MLELGNKLELAQIPLVGLEDQIKNKLRVSGKGLLNGRRRGYVIAINYNQAQKKVQEGVK